MKEAKMREMIRCLLCGRMAWPTMLGRGQLGLHRLEILRLIKGLGRGILWERRDVSKDPKWLRAMVLYVEALLEILKQRLEDLGEEQEEQEERFVEREISVVRQPLATVREFVPIVRRPMIIREQVR